MEGALGYSGGKVIHRWPLWGPAWDSHVSVYSSHPASEFSLVPATGIDTATVISKDNCQAFDSILQRVIYLSVFLKESTLGPTSPNVCVPEVLNFLETQANGSSKCSY